MTEYLAFIGIILLRIMIIFGFLMLNAAYLTWIERKIIGHIQGRMGPMITGWHGLLQPVADGIKLFFKEDIIPEHADKPVFLVSPIIPLVAVLTAFVVIPLPFPYELIHLSSPWMPEFALSDLNIGILYLLALSSVGSFGLILGGWASNSKYSQLGGLRASAQLISYEISLGLSLVGVMLLAGSANLVDIVKAQTEFTLFDFFHPGYIIVQPLAFIIFALSAIAETNRTPFDMPEAEAELVAGFMTEYSSFRFALFFMAEYMWIVMLSALGVICFLGGWHGILPTFVPPALNFFMKMYFSIFVFIWLRATLPRVRYDQLMALGWKVLIPLSLVNIVITALIKAALRT
jgi:NADH-quinone oxidoreductase subunit H